MSGLVTSLTTNPALVAPVPLSETILSPIFKVVDSTIVVVPLTKKSPFIVTLEPVNSNALSIDDDNNKRLALVVSRLFNLPFCVESIDAIDDDKLDTEPDIEVLIEELNVE